MEEKKITKWFEHFSKPVDFYRSLSHKDFVLMCEKAFKTELYRLLPTLSYGEIVSIGFELKADLNNSDVLFGKIINYMLAHPGYAFRSKTLRGFLKDYHNEVDNLILTFPFLDMVDMEEEEEEEEKEEEEE